MPLSRLLVNSRRFPISRDPPEGGTNNQTEEERLRLIRFPISRDPPEGGTYGCRCYCAIAMS